MRAGLAILLLVACLAAWVLVRGRRSSGTYMLYNDTPEPDPPVLVRDRKAAQ